MIKRYSPLISQPEPSWVSFGHPCNIAWVGLSWIELAWIWSSSNFHPTQAKPFHHLVTSANTSQLKPSCFVIVGWLCSCSQTIEWFLASWLNLAVPFGHPLMQVLIIVTWLKLAWVGSTIWLRPKISSNVYYLLVLQVKLMVLDSIAFHFRHDFDDLAHRTRLLSGLSQSFIKMACEQQIAVGIFVIIILISRHQRKIGWMAAYRGVN